MKKVKLETIKPWIVKRVTELLGLEDDVVTDFIFNMLESNQVRKGMPGGRAGRVRRDRVILMGMVRLEKGGS